MNAGEGKFLDDETDADQYFTSYGTGILHPDGGEIYRKVRPSRVDDKSAHVSFCAEDKQDLRFTKWGLVTLFTFFGGAFWYFLNENKDTNKSLAQIQVEIAKISTDSQNLKQKVDDLESKGRPSQE